VRAALYPSIILRHLNLRHKGFAKQIFFLILQLYRRFIGRWYQLLLFIGWLATSKLSIVNTGLVFGFGGPHLALSILGYGSRGA